MNKWYLYIVRCADGSLYVGITNGLKGRLKAHNSGKGAKYTYSKRPVDLVYFEEHKNHREAAKQEFQIKGWNKRKKENLIEFKKPIV